MPYEWEFETSGRPLTPQGRKCHRGPMIDVEIRMSQPCLTIPEAERIRQHLLLHIVDVNDVAVQTRETILRTLNSNLGPMFFKLYTRAKGLQVEICEKRNSLIIDEELKANDVFYRQVVESLRTYNVTKQHLDMMSDGLKSNNAIMRVAARCSVVLMVTFVEMGL
jgi:hypothetical protein